MAAKSSMSTITLYIFVLILNLVFPVISYTFTTFGPQVDSYTTQLDPDSLMIIGLNLVDGETHNVTWDGDWVEFTELNVSIRIRFGEFTRLISTRSGIAFQKPSALGGWGFPYWVSVKSIVTNQFELYAYNATLVTEFDSEFNWTRFQISDGHHIFVTPFETHGNMSQAVYEDGTLNVTIAKSFDQTEDRFNFWSFVKWYSSILVGANSWGLPPIFSLIVQILGAISFLAAIMLVKELTRI